MTDSGGVQEESSALGVRCYTLRANTERPITIAMGTNTLLGDDPAAILQVRPSRRAPVPRRIPLWDGEAGPRIADVIAAALRPRALSTNHGDRRLPSAQEARAGAPDRVEVLGCSIDPLDMRASIARCEQIIESRSTTQLVAINASKLIALRGDRRLRQIVERCELVHADGQSVVWASRLLGVPIPERVPGIELMFEVLALAERKGYRVYILGAREHVLETAVAELWRRYPRLILCGWHHGYFAAGDEAELAEEIARLGARHRDGRNVIAPQGILACRVRPHPRCSAQPRRGRLDRRCRGSHHPSARLDAANRDGVVLSVGAGTAAARAPLRRDQRAFHRIARNRACPFEDHPAVTR